MDTVTIYSPLGAQRSTAPLTLNPFPADGPLRLGILDNTKPNAAQLMQRLADQLRERYPDLEVTVERKRSAAEGAAEAVFERLGRLGLVFTGSGD